MGKTINVQEEAKEAPFGLEDLIANIRTPGEHLRRLFKAVGSAGTYKELEAARDLTEVTIKNVVEILNYELGNIAEDYGIEYEPLADPLG